MKQWFKNKVLPQLPEFTAAFGALIVGSVATGVLYPAAALVTAPFLGSWTFLNAFGVACVSIVLSYSGIKDGLTNLFAKKGVTVKKGLSVGFVVGVVAGYALTHTVPIYDTIKNTFNNAVKPKTENVQPQSQLNVAAPKASIDFKRGMTFKM